MSNVLKSLTLVAAKPASAPVDRVEQGRKNILAYLDEQHRMLIALNAGKAFVPAKRSKVVDGVKQDVDKRVRKGWFTDAAGKLNFSIRYGVKPLELAKGMTAVQVESMAKLGETIEKLVEAVKGGELDVQIKAASEARKGGRRKVVA